MTLKKTLFGAIVIAMFATALALAYLLSAPQTFASVSITSEYMATTTGQAAYGNTITTSKVIATSSLTLGSVVITGANTGILNFYDATTSNAALRKLASSSILIASIPASAAAGTYTFDVRLNDGLYVELESGIMPTTTITWRR